MRVHLKGIHEVKKRLAGGATATYYYAWRGGPRIVEKPGTPAFFESYNRAISERRQPEPDTFRVLIEEFRNSADMTSKAESTRRAYKAYLDDIEREFGDLPIAALSEPETRGEFKEWRDRMSSTPRKADYAWTTLARVLSVAKDRGRIPVNPCERGGRLYESDRTEHLWTDQHIAQFNAHADERLRLALTIALWTGQRQGDLLGLQWKAYDGTRIRLKQSKTGATVMVRAGAPLKEALDRTERRGDFILTNRSGNAWTSDGFRSSWGKACSRAGIKDVTFHDLRGSAVTRLALVGASVQEIASVTGHSIKDVAAMLDRHYLGDRAVLADQAIRRLESASRQSRGPSGSQHRRRNRREPDSR